MPVKPVPSPIGGVVMGVDVATAGSGVEDVVVVGEGDAWRPEALGAPSKVDSLVRSCPWFTPSSVMLSPASFSLSLFLSTGLVSTSSTEGALKADCSPSSELSAPSTGPCKTPKVQRQVLQVRALQALALLVPQALSSRWCPPLCPYFSSPFLLRTVLGALGVRHGVAAGT